MFLTVWQTLLWNRQALNACNSHHTAGTKTLRSCQNNYWCLEEVNNQIVHHFKLIQSKPSAAHVMLKVPGLGKLVV